MARSKSKGLGDWLYRKLLQLVEIIVTVSALIYLINLVGVCIIRFVRSGCQLNNHVFNTLTISDWCIMLFLFGGLFLLRRANS